ncbi:MAG: outer membrane protein [Bauldia sp.]
MRRLTKLLAGAAALATVAGTAVAADVPVIVPPAPPVVVVPPPAPASPFAGFYAGAVAGWLPSDYFSVSAQAGFNFVRGRLLVGVEGQIGVLFAGGPLLGGEVTARAGVLLGSRAVVYGEAGALFLPANAPPVFGLIGGGVEFAVNDRISVFAEAKNLIGTPAVEFQAGINFHFGR